MFGDVNKVTLMGNVTKDPDLRFTPSGAAVLSFSIATNRRYKSGEEWKDEPSFHNIVVWRNAESLSKRLKKGTRLYVEGRLQTRSWDDAEGKKQYKTEIVVDSVVLIARYEGDNHATDKVAVEDLPVSNDESTIEPDDLPF
jgi:single-strand DNA-binding protein